MSLSGESSAMPGVSNPFASVHPSLQDDYSTDFIHQCLVTSGHLAQTTLEHGLMGQHTGVPLVPHVQRNVRELLLQSVGECHYSRQVVTVTPIRLLGESQYKSLHGLACHISLDEIHQLRCGHCGQSSRYYLQRVRHSQTCTTDPVVY